MVVSFGFHSASANTIYPQNDCWEFNFATSKWVNLYLDFASETDMARGGHISVVYNNHLYVYGGLRYANNMWSNEEGDGSSKVWRKVRWGEGGGGRGKVFLVL